jgi:hypothetical protein
MSVLGKVKGSFGMSIISKKEKLDFFVRSNRAIRSRENVNERFIKKKRNSYPAGDNKSRLENKRSKVAKVR